jgi:hypothetical protein
MCTYYNFETTERNFMKFNFVNFFFVNFIDIVPKIERDIWFGQEDLLVSECMSTGASLDNYESKGITN